MFESRSVVPKSSFQKRAGSGCVGLGRGMTVEAVPRDSTELTHPALQAQRSTLQAPIYTEHTQAYVPSPAHHSWRTWPYLLGPVGPIPHTLFYIRSPIREHLTAIIFSRTVVITCKKPSRPGLSTADVTLIGSSEQGHWKLI